MMGIHLDDPAEIRVDDMSVAKNASIPTSTLKKKYSIVYHYIRSQAAAVVANNEEHGREDFERRCNYVLY